MFQQFSHKNSFEREVTTDQTLDQQLWNLFFKWLLIAVSTLVFLALVTTVLSTTARAADVFIDEGDADYEQPMPVETPADQAAAPDQSVAPLSPDAEVEQEAGVVSQESAPENTVDIDKDFPNQQLTGELLQQSPPVEAAPVLLAPVVPPAPKKVVKKKASLVKPVARSQVKAKSKAKVVKTKKMKKASAPKRVAHQTKKIKRKIASTKYAGGKYVVTAKDCVMESSPGAGDAVGKTASGRKLWVEDVGDAGYWRVYSRSGKAAYLARSCF